MKRTYLQHLEEWQHKPTRKPLLVRGARQIGKTYLIRDFAKQHFTHLLEINFEQQKEYHACFNTLYPQEILQKISALTQQNIIPGKVLLFLDEIQECPEAIKSLRYFFEQMPTLHVIAAGSLLEFTLRQESFRMPVGRVESLYMKPLSFKEFLMAHDASSLIDIIENATIESGIDVVFHKKLLHLLKYYFLLGGMPEVIATYLAHKDLLLCQDIQRTILDSYAADFGKYSQQRNLQYIQGVYNKAPGMIAQNFKYSHVDPTWHSREIKPVIADLIDASIIHKVIATKASGLPLATNASLKKFKILFLDLGLVSNTTALSSKILMQDNLILLNKGVMAEQFVGQELLAYAPYNQKVDLYYWHRDKGSSSAEVDYITHVDTNIIPIEVKAGATGRLRSLQQYLNDKNAPLGVRISEKPLAFDGRILSIPLYMIWQLPRLITSVLESPNA